MSIGIQLRAGQVIKFHKTRSAEQIDLFSGFVFFLGGGEGRGGGMVGKIRNV